MNIGDLAPEFSLPDMDRRLHSLRDHRGQIVILNFWSCECPHVERTDALLTAWIGAWDKRVELWPIASNANEVAGAIKSASTKRRLPFVLVDYKHRVADLYGAQTTPHVFVVDADGVIRYAGAVDDVNFSQRQPQRFLLQEAVQAILDGESPLVTITQPYGCVIVRHALE